MPLHHYQGVRFVKDPPIAGEFHEVVGDKFGRLFAAADSRIQPLRSYSKSSCSSDAILRKSGSGAQPSQFLSRIIIADDAEARCVKSISLFPLLNTYSRFATFLALGSSQDGASPWVLAYRLKNLWGPFPWRQLARKTSFLGFFRRPGIQHRRADKIPIPR
jgi:hypothetical protein